MAIYKLLKKDGDIEGAELAEASRTQLALEKHLESWLERSPWAIAQEPLLIISRQATATLEDRSIYPDLLALDSDGNLVIVELKKGRAPRDVIAQSLDYAAWANNLSEDEISDLAERYFALAGCTADQSLNSAFEDCFGAEVLPPLNSRLRIFIAAEDIPSGISRVARFLRTEHAMDINCVQFTIYQTDAGEILVNSDLIVGAEETRGVKKSETSSNERWNGKPAKDIVREAVQEIVASDQTKSFAPKEVVAKVLGKHPDFNKSTITCQLIADCVNHTSRHHYPGGQRDYYWWLQKGKYRLFNPSTDKKI